MSSSSSHIFMTLGGAAFPVPTAALSKFTAVNTTLTYRDAAAGDHRIPVPAVTDDALEMIIRWAKKHTDAAASPEELREWDSQLVKWIQKKAMLGDFLVGAAFLGAAELVKLVADTAAEMVGGRNAEHIQDLLLYG